HEQLARRRDPEAAARTHAGQLVRDVPVDAPAARDLADTKTTGRSRGPAARSTPRRAAPPRTRRTGRARRIRTDAEGAAMTGLRGKRSLVLAPRRSPRALARVPDPRLVVSEPAHPPRDAAATMYGSVRAGATWRRARTSARRS